MYQDKVINDIRALGNTFLSLADHLDATFSTQIIEHEELNQKLEKTNKKLRTIADILREV